MTLRTVSALILGATLAAGQAPPTAASLVGKAKVEAASSKRAIFAIFHASWCGWCKQLDKFMESPENRPIFEKYFVTVHITVQEAEEKKALDTPGGDEMMKRFGGPAGLPFFAFLDGSGSVIVNSLREGKPGSNIGHPVQPEEIDWFLVMLRKAAPGMTSGEIATLEKWLRTQKT